MIFKIMEALTVWHVIRRINVKHAIIYIIVRVVTKVFKEIFKIKNNYFILNYFTIFFILKGFVLEMSDLKCIPINIDEDPIDVNF